MGGTWPARGPGAEPLVVVAPPEAESFFSVFIQRPNDGKS